MNNQPFKEYCNYLRSTYSRNNRILLVELPQFSLKTFDLDVARRRGYYCFPPTGLQYIYQSLKTRDLEFEILDLNFLILKTAFEDVSFHHSQWLDILSDRMDSYDPFIVGVSCKFDSSIEPLVRVLDFLKHRDRSIVITGGVIPTYEWSDLLSRGTCHFVIQGEGEERMSYLFDQLTYQNLNCIPTAGIRFKYGDHFLESSGKRGPVTVQGDLTETYDLVCVEEYYRYGSLNPFSRMAGVQDTPFAAIQLSRGCRGACNFCAVRDFMGRGVRRRPLNDVFNEMEFLVTQRGVRHFEWLDDDLLFYKKDFQCLLEKIIEQQWNITWSANNGLIAKSIDDKILGLMRNSGCIGFKIGIETGNADMLREIKKPATLQTFRVFSEKLASCPEIFVGGNFMLGFPKEKFSQMMDSFLFYLELNLDWAAFTLCQAIRGATAFADFHDYFGDQMRSGGKVTKNFVPVRDPSNNGVGSDDKVFTGLEIFSIDPDSIPGEEQIKEIWFTFNLVGNFINNRNLRPDGEVNKFISWVEMAQLPYPTNPYMSLFLALAYSISGDSKNSQEYLKKAVEHSQTSYWNQRFRMFRLTDILDNFPRNKSQTFNTIKELSEFISSYYCPGSSHVSPKSTKV